MEEPKITHSIQGDNNPTVDAGYIPNGKIGDFVWEDKNGNGQQDSGELGILRRNCTIVGSKQ
jgi:hypothetical protein